MKKCWSEQNSRSVSGDLPIFWIFCKWSITVPSFAIVGLVQQVLGWERLAPPTPWFVISSEKAHPE